MLDRAGKTFLMEQTAHKCGFNTRQIYDLRQEGSFRSCLLPWAGLVPFRHFGFSSLDPWRWRKDNSQGKNEGEKLALSNAELSTLPGLLQVLLPWFSHLWVSSPASRARQPLAQVLDPGPAPRAEFPHSCPQPALDQASDELSAFDLHAWLSITGHGAPSFPALGPHGNVVFILAGMSPGGAQHQTPSPSFCQAAVVTPTPHPRLSLPSLWSGVWPAPWEGERENWEAGGLEGAIAAL